MRNSNLQPNSNVQASGNFRGNIPLPEETFEKVLDLYVDNSSIINESWSKLGNCFKIDPDVMYPKDDEGIKIAKEICENCPVRAECLATALRNKERYGIWGGLTEPQRTRLARRIAALRITQ